MLEQSWEFGGSWDGGKRTDVLVAMMIWSGQTGRERWGRVSIARSVAKLATGLASDLSQTDEVERAPGIIKGVLRGLRNHPQRGGGGGGGGGGPNPITATTKRPDSGTAQAANDPPKKRGKKRAELARSGHGRQANADRTSHQCDQAPPRADPRAAAGARTELSDVRGGRQVGPPVRPPGRVAAFQPRLTPDD